MLTRADQRETEADHLGDPEMRASHGTIYECLYLQGRSRAVMLHSRVNASRHQTGAIACRTTSLRIRVANADEPLGGGGR